jgi:hypothetical protein
MVRLAVRAVLPSLEELVLVKQFLQRAEGVLSIQHAHLTHGRSCEED